MNKKETLTRPERRKKNIEKYIETHEKRGERYWNELIDKEVKEIEGLYEKQISHCQCTIEKLSDEIGVEIIKEEKEIEKLLIEGKISEDVFNKRLEAITKKEDMLRDKVETLEESINRVEKAKNEISSYKKHRSQEIGEDDLKHIRMERPPDEIIEGLKAEIEKLARQYHQSKEIEDLKKILNELIDYKISLIDIYIILKKAERIF